MSIVCTKVDESVCRRAALRGALGFVYATIDPVTKNQLNLPSDYKYHSVFLPQLYAQWANRLRSFKVREDDIWICGFPKTGTAWLHNILKYLRNNLDFSALVQKPIEYYFEAVILYELPNFHESVWKPPNYDNRLDEYEAMESSRVLKSHLPAFLLPRQIWIVKPKIVYIWRDPRDVAISYFHQHRNNFNQYSGTAENICDLFMKDEIRFSPFIDHINSFWQLRHLDHVLFLTYEELSRDLFAGVKRVSEFLAYSYTDEQLKMLTNHLSFGSMRSQILKSSSPCHRSMKKDPDYCHCRKGKIGGYRDDLSPEFIKKIDDWTEGQFKDAEFKCSENV